MDDLDDLKQSLGSHTSASSYWQSESIYPALFRLLRVDYSRIVYQIIQSSLSKPALDFRIA